MFACATLPPKATAKKKGRQNQNSGTLNLFQEDFSHASGLMYIRSPSALRMSGVRWRYEGRTFVNFIFQHCQSRHTVCAIVVVELFWANVPFFFCFPSGSWSANMSLRLEVISLPLALMFAWHFLMACICRRIWMRFFFFYHQCVWGFFLNWRLNKSVLFLFFKYPGSCEHGLSTAQRADEAFSSPCSCFWVWTHAVLNIRTICNYKGYFYMFS